MHFTNNFLREQDGKNKWSSEEENEDCPLERIEPIATGSGSHNALATREKLANYFISGVGSIPWQYDHI